MVELLCKYPTRPRKSGQGDFTVPCPAAPFLRVPTNYPTRISIELDLADFPQFHRGFSAFTGEAEEDEELSIMASDALGDFFFNPKVWVASIGDSNVAFIDPHETGVTAFPIGGRVRLLDKYFGAGGFLLSLIEQGPIEVWNPNTMKDLGSYHFYTSNHEDPHRGQHELPLWDDLPKTKHERPKELPPNLSRIVDECLASKSSYNLGQRPDGVNLTQFPLGVALWDDLIPFQNKTTKKTRDFGVEKGTNISWLVMDEMGSYCMETGAQGSCTDLIHSLDQFESILTHMKPFVKLYKYLSHETEEITFTCTF